MTGVPPSTGGPTLVGGPGDAMPLIERRADHQSRFRMEDAAVLAAARPIDERTYTLTYPDDRPYAVSLFTFTVGSDGQPEDGDVQPCALDAAADPTSGPFCSFTALDEHSDAISVSGVGGRNAVITASFFDVATGESSTRTWVLR